MKTLKILTMIAMCGTSLSPMMAPMAYAQSTTTESTMAATCATDLGANASVLLHDGSNAFSTEVEVTGSVVGSPTEVLGTRVVIPGTVHGTGAFTLGPATIEGDPYRIGGSVNMFGKQVSGRKDWGSSEYDFTADYDTTTTYSYACHVTQVTEFYTDPVFIPGHKVEGYYVDWDQHGQGHDNEQPTEGSCIAHNSQGPSWEKWGENTEQCFFVKTGDATEDETIPGFWTNNPPIDRPDLSTTHTVNETTTASGSGHATDGGPVYELGRFIGQAVICISPSKTVKGGVPGAWQNHNGYTGTKCTTAWFNVAAWGAGSETSQGTYISVPLI